MSSAVICDSHAGYFITRKFSGTYCDLWYFKLCGVAVILFYGFFLELQYNNWWFDHIWDKLRIFEMF